MRKPRTRRVFHLIPRCNGQLLVKETDDENKIKIKTKYLFLLSCAEYAGNDSLRGLLWKIGGNFDVFSRD